jgi:hypothetical protein
MRSMWGGRRNRYHAPKPKVWGESYIVTREDGTVVHSQRENIGYGRSHLVFVGTFEGVTAAVESVLRSYPTAGYGTSFNWPPGRTYAYGERMGQEIEYEKPEEISPGLWVLFGSHSESCD